MARIALFRAVEVSELQQIIGDRRFCNPLGIERKYFATTLEGARQFARMATEMLDLGPFTIVQSFIDLSRIWPDLRVKVDRGIETVVLPTDLLSYCDSPCLLEVDP